MKILIVGNGNQGKKRIKVETENVIGVVDPLSDNIHYKNVEEVPLNDYEVAYVCCPDSYKKEIVQYLVNNKKHVLIEKPFYPISIKTLKNLNSISKKNNTVIYVAYNHRFEPNIIDIKKALDKQLIGKVYHINFFYGNGTSADILNSTWKNKEKKGVFQDLGPHIFDMLDFFNITFEVKNIEDGYFESFETYAYDYCQFRINSNVKISVTLSNLSWKNNFLIDCIGEQGSIHAKSLCKWGDSETIIRKRVFPSGVPIETKTIYSMPDITWAKERDYFKYLITKGISGVVEKEFKISKILNLI